MKNNYEKLINEFVKKEKDLKGGDYSDTTRGNNIRDLNKVFLKILITERLVKQSFTKSIGIVITTIILKRKIHLFVGFNRKILDKIN